MIAYILQVILFQLLFLLVYEVLLKKETFFSYNRWYLLITAVFSIILPFIKIEALSLWLPAESLSQMPTVFLPEVFIGSDAGVQNIEHLPAVEINSTNAGRNPWAIIYLLGVLTSLVIFLKKYNNLRKMFRYKKVYSESYLTIIEIPNSSIACTFYRTIFLGDQLSGAQKEQILSHELVHVKQKHSLDLVFFEILKVIFWFNPLIYIFQSRIASLHEFIADAAVVKVIEKRNYYEQLLNCAFNTSNISFINQFFNHSLIKKRIVMLQRSKSKTSAKVKYLILVPLMLIMLTYVSCSEEKMENGKEESIAQQVQNLKATIERRKYLTVDEAYHLNSLQKDYMEKVEIIEVVQDNPPRKYSEGEDVPFTVVEEVPIYPGCEDLSSNEERKKCMSDKIKEFVTRRFNTNLGKELGLEGTNIVYTGFKIDVYGQVIDVHGRRNPHPELEAEAIRVISEMPKMIPGKHGGNNVVVSYSLPIVLQVGE